MYHIIFRALVCVFLLISFSANAESLNCSIKYHLKGWSFFYQNYQGSGVVSCPNGQHAKVSITLHGGGLTLGVIDIENAKGRFTGVKNIQDIYGTHFSIGMHAGFARSAEARALFKGYIAGGSVGSGGGYNLGITFSGMTIKH